MLVPTLLKASIDCLPAYKAEFNGRGLGTEDVWVDFHALHLDYNLYVNARVDLAMLPGWPEPVEGKMIETIFFTLGFQNLSNLRIDSPAAAGEGRMKIAERPGVGGRFVVSGHLNIAFDFETTHVINSKKVLVDQSEYILPEREA